MAVDFYIFLKPSIWHLLTAISVLATLAWLLFKYAYGTDIPKIKGIPEPAGALPFYGHLKSLSIDHPSAFEKFKEPVAQAKLGNRRILVINSFEAAQEIMVKHSAATIDRPLFHTFHSVVSKTQGGTVGTAPWNDSTKKMRTVTGSLMTRPAIQRSAPMLDLETSALVDGLYQGTKEDTKDVDPRIYFQKQALNLTLMWCYGTRIDSVQDSLLHKILRVAHSVSS